MGPFDVTGVSGLCEGVLFRLIRSVTSTSSPTRRTAPYGPAQAYWPKTGLFGNFSLTLLSFANNPYSCRFVAIMPPLVRSAFRLKQRTVRNRHRTETSCSRSAWERMESILQPSSPYGSCSSFVSTCTFGRNRMMTSSLRATGGKRRRASSSEAVVVSNRGAASAKRSLCG